MELLLILFGCPPLLLLLNRVLSVARDLEVHTQHGHIGRDTRGLVNLLVSPIQVDWAESKNLVN